MNRERSTNPSRIDAWRRAAFVALIAAAMMLVVVKMVTGIMLMTAFLFAAAIFMLCFGFLMRTTPR